MAKRFGCGRELTSFPMERESGCLGCDAKAAIAVVGCQKSLPFCIYGSLCWALLQDLGEALSFESGLW